LRELILASLPPSEPAQELDLSGSLTYQATIQPLFQTRCGACHGESGLQGLNLLTYSTAFAGSVNGSVIIPGDPDASMLIQRQTQDQPHFGQFNPEELQIVQDWILAGAPEQ